MNTPTITPINARTGYLILLFKVIIVYRFIITNHIPKILTETNIVFKNTEFIAGWNSPKTERSIIGSKDRNVVIK